MSLQQFTVPAEVASVLARQGLGDASARVCACARLRRDGSYGQTWLAVDTKRLCVVAAGQKPELLHAFDLKELTAARNIPAIGGGAVVLESAGKLREILRYPASQTRLFGALIGELGRALENKAEPASAAPVLQAADRLAAALAAMRASLEKEQRMYCPRCERQFPKNSEICPFCIQKRRTIFRLLGFSRPYRRQIAVITLLMAAGTALQVLPPKLTGWLVDRVLIGKDTSQLAGLLGLLAGTMILQALIQVWRGRLSVWVGGQITNAIRLQAYGHLQSLSLSYFDKQQTGALMSRISQDTQRMQDFLVDGVQFTIINLLLLLVVAILLIAQNPLLGTLVLLPMPLVAIVSKLAWKYVFFRFRKCWDSIALMHAYLGDSLSGVREIKATGQESRVAGTFEQKSGDAAQRTIDAEQTWQTLIPFLSLMIQMSTILVWYFGAKEEARGAMTVGELISFIALMGLMFGPLQLLTRLNDWLARSLTAAERVFEIVDVPPAITEAPQAVALEKPAGRVELRNVVFGYEKHKPVLKNVSFSVEPGEMIGLVGKSGSGKSTLMKLILRLYDADQGAILIDGHDVRQIRRADLCHHVGVVLQDPFLFNGTIAENIALARPGARPDEIIRAAVAANAHEFIMKLPNGYDSRVGERGSSLSGGERQRIAIARALISDPKILILDEATSSVDTETEQKIQQALQRLVRGRTTIAIAHRLSTLRYARRLVVMEDGAVKEIGTHDELMAKEDGTFHKLVTIQTTWAHTIAVGG